jgi:hypothetical protein
VLTQDTAPSVEIERLRAMVVALECENAALTDALGDPNVTHPFDPMHAEAGGLRLGTGRGLVLRVARCCCCPPHPGQGAGRTGGAVTDRCCDDIAVHSHDGGLTMQRNGVPCTWRAEFQWRRPRLTWYRTADRYRFKSALNRYPGIVIGAQIVIGHRALGVLWGRPGRIVYLPTETP